MFFRKKIKQNEEKRSDEALIDLYKTSGDYSVLAELYTRYSHFAYGVCLKYLKDKDDSKDAVVHIYEKLCKDVLRHEIKNFPAWLHMVVKNHCLMQIRAQKGKYSVEIDERFMENELLLHPIEESVHEDEKLNKLEDCLNKLVEEQKHCVDLFYYQEKSYKEIQDITGFEMMKVKSYIQNGKRNLKICIETN